MSSRGTSSEDGIGAPTAFDLEAWHRYDDRGFLDLGPLLSLEQVGALCRRSDEYALGRRSTPAIQLQVDTGGSYDSLPVAVSRLPAHTLAYRKVQGLEHDDLFASVLAHPTLAEVALRQYGAHATLSIFRAMVMNKSANLGTELPWHQDGGDVWALDRDPLVTIWIALDPATVENGCVEVIPGSHRLGLLSSEGSTLTPAAVEQFCPSAEITPLEVPAGHGVLLHNWLIHRSGVNRTGAPRRAFTTCVLDGRTRSTLTGNPFPMLRGSAPATAPFVSQLLTEGAELRRSAESAAEYALSLRADNSALQASIAEATAYARTLEREIASRGA